MRPAKQAYRLSYLLALLLLGCLLFTTVCTASPRHARRSRRSLPHSAMQLKQRKANLQSKIHKVRTQIRQVKYHEQQTKAHLNDATRRLQVSRQELHYAALQLLRKQIELHRASLQLKDAKQDFQSARRDAGQRMVATYELGDQGYLHLLLSADNLGDLLQRSQFAHYMVAQDRNIMDGLKQHQVKVAQYHGKVKAKTAEVASWKTRVAILHEKTARERAVTAQHLTQTMKERAGLESELDALERDSASVTSMLQLMQRSTAGRRRYTTHYAVSSGRLPVAGRITSPFGYRVHPISHTRKLHTGVDIAAPIGTPIFAAGAGTILWAGRRGGYGNAVIIDHGGGRATLYGHMSAVLVHSGQVVANRQLIGRVGSTGISTGPHCHFELRINGVPVNPL